ncbi:MAG: hypothetical protein KDA25_07630 [Phycisphaerales bacterium]|nr:hypothetical protein [Phycisphaerales bacterium]
MNVRSDGPETSARPSVPPIEAAPMFETGHEPVALDAWTRTITSEEVGAVLGAITDAAGVGAVTIDALREGGSGIGVRVDLTDGLTASGVALVADVARRGIAATVGVSAFAAGDLVITNGEAIAIDPRAHPLLSRLDAGGSPRAVLLNELADAFLATASAPWAVLTDVADRLAALGLPVGGLATPVTDDAADALNLMLLHGATAAWADAVMTPFDLDAAEIKFLPARPDAGGSGADFVGGLHLDDALARGPVFSRRLGVTVGARPTVRAARTVDRVLATGRSGWRVCDGSGRWREGLDVRAATAALGSGAGGRTLVVISTAHVRAAPSERRVVRPLPYPFRHYLAVNSDVDWSTAAQVEAIRVRLHDDLGLPIAGSFYGVSSGGTSIGALTGGPGAALREASWDGYRVARWFHQGAIDTFHAWMDSVQVIELHRDGTAWTGLPEASAHAARGVLITATGPLDGVRVRGRAAGSAACAVSAAPGGPDEAGRFHGWVDLAPASMGDGVTIESGGGVVIESVLAVELSPGMIGEVVSALDRDGVSPLLWTTHGGGRGVRVIANLHAAAGAKAFPAEIAHDMDRRSSPFGVMDSLGALGVRFVSPIGHASTPMPTSLRDLVQEIPGADGVMRAAFRRVLSRRHVELGFAPSWPGGKNMSHPSAFGFEVSDLVQRLHWLEAGRGGVLYTHLGHDRGNQRATRGTGWSHETEAAFAGLAARYHGDDDTALRVWIAPASSVLLLSRVMQVLAGRIAVTGSAVAVTSAGDPVLGVTVPDLERYGTRLLHGLTVHVDDAAAATVAVDGRAVTSFTRNGPDETGRESVTIVDDSSVRRVVIDDLEGVTDVERAIAPVPLGGVTHMRFDLEAADGVMVRVGVRDARGTWYDVGDGDEAAWGWRGARRGRHVWSLAARRPCASGPPRGSITGVRVVSTGAVSVRGWSLVRPRGSVRADGSTRVLAGRVTWGGPVDAGAWRVEVDGCGTVHRSAVGDDGAWVCRDLSRDSIVSCRLVCGARSFTGVRGARAMMTCDQWDWDFDVRGSDLVD